MEQKLVTVNLSMVNHVKEFCNDCMMSACDVQVVSGRYTVDGKSILGLFSIDLSHNITVKISGEEEDINALVSKISKFEVN